MVNQLKLGERNMRRMISILVAAAALGVTSAEAQTPSIWTDIMQKKKLTVCIVP